MDFPTLQAASNIHGPVANELGAAPSESAVLPPPPKVPRTGPYGKGKEEFPEGKGKNSPVAMWMAGGGGCKPATGWKNYMVPLLGVLWLHLFEPPWLVVEPCGWHVASRQLLG